MSEAAAGILLCEFAEMHEGGPAEGWWNGWGPGHEAQNIRHCLT